MPRCDVRFSQHRPNAAKCCRNPGVVLIDIRPESVVILNLFVFAILRERIAQRFK